MRYAYKAKGWEHDGVIVFSTGDLDDRCEDPGCAVMMKIKGVIYPVRDGERWVPQIKANYVIDFPEPDEPGANSGEVKATSRLRKSP